MRNSTIAALTLATCIMTSSCENPLGPPRWKPDSPISESAKVPSSLSGVGLGDTRDTLISKGAISTKSEMYTQADLKHSTTSRSGRWRKNSNESEESLFGIKARKRFVIYSSDAPNKPVWSIDEIYEFSHVDSTKTIIDGYVSRYGRPSRSFQMKGSHDDIHHRLIYASEPLDHSGTKPDATFFCSVEQACKRDTVADCQSEGAVFKRPFMTINIQHESVRVTLSDTSFLPNYPIPNHSTSRCDTPSGPMISEG